MDPAARTQQKLERVSTRPISDTDGPRVCYGYTLVGCTAMKLGETNNYQRRLGEWAQCNPQYIWFPDPVETRYRRQLGEFDLCWHVRKLVIMLSALHISASKPWASRERQSTAGPAIAAISSGSRGAWILKCFGNTLFDLC